MHARLAVAGCLACGCGRIAFDTLAAAEPDAGASCAPWTPDTTFATPVRVGELSSGTLEQQPHLSSDGLTIYFASTRSGDFHIYTANRADRDAEFASVRLLSEIGSTRFDTAFAPTADELAAYLSSDVGGVTDLYITERATTAQPFGQPTLFSASTMFIDYDPIESADQLRLYWVIDAWDQGVGGTDVVVATRPAPSDSFGLPRLLDALATAADEDNPSETADGRMLVFGSTRGGAGDIYYATRSSTADAYAAPVLVPTVNQPMTDDTEGFVTPDGCELWFTSDRGGAYDIYVARVER